MSTYPPPRYPASRKIDRSVVTGSRKHVLDWTERPTFLLEAMEMLSPMNVVLAPTSFFMPRGYNNCAEARLETFGPRVMPDTGAWSELRQWWLRYHRGANTPNWDIALNCEVEGERGLILVEAKANHPELSRAGKPAGGTAEKPASAASTENHDRIGVAISEACLALGAVNAGFNISRDSHYQLSNRIAFAWKLASLGIPTILIYLGFTGDRELRGAFRDEADWRGAFDAYSRGIIPPGIIEKRISTAGAPFWILVRARVLT